MSEQKSRICGTNICYKITPCLPSKVSFRGEHDLVAQSICIATSLALQKDKILFSNAKLYFSLKGWILSLVHKTTLCFPPTINPGLVNQNSGNCFGHDLEDTEASGQETNWQ